MAVQVLNDDFGAIFEKKKNLSVKHLIRESGYMGKRFRQKKKTSQQGNLSAYRINTYCLESSLSDKTENLIPVVHEEK